MKFNRQMGKEYNKYIDDEYDSEPFDNGFYFTYDQIKRNAKRHIQARFQFLLRLDKQYSLIRKIKEKYNAPLEKEYIIFDNAEDRQIYMNLMNNNY